MEFESFLHLILKGPTGWIIAWVWGVLWGSFFNVLIVRVPVSESLVKPASHCRSCRTPIAWYDNIPIISYLVLRGRCRHCGAKFSVQYLMVEFCVSVLSVLMFWLFLIKGKTSLGLSASRFVISSLFCGLLVAIAVIDLKTFRIPDAITYPSIPICMILSIFMGHPHAWDGPVGGIVGYLFIRLIADGYFWLTGREGMGYGDAKLLAMIGGLLGWQVIFPTLFLSALQGSIIGISILALYRRKQRKQGVHQSQQQEQRGCAPQESPEIIEAESLSAQEGEHQAESSSTLSGADQVEPPSTSTQGRDQDMNCSSGEVPHEDGLIEEAAEDCYQPHEPLRLARIPFGPFLSLAAIEIILLYPWLYLFFPYLW